MTLPSATGLPAFNRKEFLDQLELAAGDTLDRLGLLLGLVRSRGVLAMDDKGFRDIIRATPGLLAATGPGAKTGAEGKARFDLVPARVEAQLAECLTRGAAKHGVDNWRKLAKENPEEFRRCYYSASRRHLSQWFLGLGQDPETGLHPLVHAMASLAFLVDVDLDRYPAPEVTP